MDEIFTPHHITSWNASMPSLERIIRKRRPPSETKLISPGRSKFQRTKKIDRREDKKKNQATGVLKRIAGIVLIWIGGSSIYSYSYLVVWETFPGRSDSWTRGSEERRLRQTGHDLRVKFERERKINGRFS